MNIVAIGGGTGLPVVLEGLKKYLYPRDRQHHFNELTAIVTVADDGGSSGRLRRDLDILPPGDIRNCLVALADTASILPDLFQYRFTKSPELNSHSMGNLLLAALSELTHDFQYAIQTTGRLLGVHGRVLPSTLERVELGAKLKNRRIIWGETAITKNGNGIEEVFLRPEDPSPVPLALEAIASADAIILGPGSLYTSLIPNLLIRGIVEAISESSAKKICVMNLMTQPGETDGYTAEDHLDAIFRHCGRPIFDYVILNAKEFEDGPLKEYKSKGSMPVDYNLRRIIKQGTICPIEEHVASETTKIRHDPDKLAQTILNVIRKKHGRTRTKGLRPSGDKTSNLQPQTPNIQPLPRSVATLGRIPLNMDLPEPCVNCLWLEWDKNKKECANRGTRVCPLFGKEIFKDLEPKEA